MFKAGIITVSDKGAEGKREDQSGERLKELLLNAGFKLEKYVVIPDEQDQIIDSLNEMVERNVHLALTSGGTGLSPRDNTPEATLYVVDRLVPGFAEEIRRVSTQKTPHGMLTRGVAGIKAQTLIINFPGSPKAVTECYQIIEPALQHALATMTGQAGECATPKNHE